LRIWISLPVSVLVGEYVVDVLSVVAEHVLYVRPHYPPQSVEAEAVVYILLRQVHETFNVTNVSIMPRATCSMQKLNLHRNGTLPA